MTELSKARKRHPMMIVSVPKMDPEYAKTLLSMLRKGSTIVLPEVARIEVIPPMSRKLPPPILSGVSVRMGVGGRRQRKRRRALAGHLPGTAPRIPMVSAGKTSRSRPR
jgi:hypothetical protein